VDGLARGSVIFSIRITLEVEKEVCMKFLPEEEYKLFKFWNFYAAQRNN
jgi:hypothetical protein